MIRADCGADTAASRTAAFGTVGSGTVGAGGTGMAGLVAVEVVRFGTAEPLRVPALSVIAQVVVDISRVAPIAPIGRRAPVPRRA